MMTNSIIPVLQASRQWWALLRAESGVPNTPIPNLLLQAAVEKGKKTDDGEIVIAVTAVWYEIIKLIEKDPSVIHKIDWRKLEEIVAGMHERTGIFDEVILTPRSGDRGRDVVLIRHGHYSLHFFDQIKAYSSKRLVTADMIKASLLTMEGNNYQKVIVTTTGSFAPRLLDDPAITRYYPKQLELVDGEELHKRLIVYSKKK